VTGTIPQEEVEIDEEMASMIAKTLTPKKPSGAIEESVPVMEDEESSQVSAINEPTDEQLESELEKLQLEESGLKRRALLAQIGKQRDRNEAWIVGMQEPPKPILPPLGMPQPLLAPGIASMQDGGRSHMELNYRRVADPPFPVPRPLAPSAGITLPQLRSSRHYNDMVDRILDGGPAADLYGSTRPNQSEGKCLSPRDTVSSLDVVRGILWPHEFIHRTGQQSLKHDSLTLPELVAGVSKILLYAGIAQNEKEARTRHLRDLMYLARKYNWPAVRSLYGAVLDDLRKGLREWDDPIGNLEHEVLSPADLLVKGAGSGYKATSTVPGGSGGTKINICRKWNYEVCPRESEGKVCFYAHKCHSCYMYRHAQADHKASTCSSRLAYLKTKAAGEQGATSTASTE
jgi:hypothetical protein